MAMFVRITGCSVSQQGATLSTTYIVIADNSGRQLRIVSPSAGGYGWNSEPILCNDTLESILLYVYTRDTYRPDELVGIGKFDFNQIKALPYQKINVNVPIVLQNMNRGVVNLEAEYNQGQILIGTGSHIELGSAVFRPAETPSSLVSAGTNTTTLIVPPIIASNMIETVTIPPVVQSVVQPAMTTTTTAVAGFGGYQQDGLTPIQMTDFYPSYNLFSMWDVHYPDTHFRMVQPHLKRVVYR